MGLRLRNHVESHLKNLTGRMHVAITKSLVRLHVIRPATLLCKVQKLKFEQ